MAEDDSTTVLEDPILDEEQTAETDTPPAEEEAEEVVVTIGEEAPPPEEERAPEWVRELRHKHRELARENQELKAKLGTTETKPVIGPKPKLDDFDYDAEKFEVALTAWHEQKRKADEAQAKANEQAQAQQQEWNTSLEKYTVASKELKVKDFTDAEAAVQETLNIVQQGILIKGSEDPALLVYALGKNPAKAKELASITDPVKFAFAVAKLETKLKVTNRKPATPPEKVVSGSGRSSGSVDSTLEKLRAEAEKTGDYTQVTAYKRSKRA